MPDKSLQLLTA